MSGGGVADPGPNRHAAILLHFQLNLPGSLSVRRRVTPLSVTCCVRFLNSLRRFVSLLFGDAPFYHITSLTWIFLPQAFRKHSRLTLPDEGYKIIGDIYINCFAGLH